MEQNQQPLVCERHTAAYVVTFIVGVIIGILGMVGFVKVGPFSFVARYLSPTPPKVSLQPLDIRVIGGTVESVASNKIVVTSPSFDFNAGQISERHTVVITPATHITRATPRDPEEVQKETEAFMRKLQTPSRSGSSTPTLPTPPSPVTITDAQIGDIKTGMHITITAGENIRNTKEFNATEVQI